MTAEGWYILIGLLLGGIAFTGTLITRLPVTTAMIYFTVGMSLSSERFHLIHLDPITNADAVERLSEVAILISLFTAGLKLRVPIGDARWWLAVRLAFGSMILTVALGAMAGMFLLNLSLGAAVLLAAILSPTDPVLASDVQVNSPLDQNQLRFALTGEAGLNDGTALPFVLLGLILTGPFAFRDVGVHWFFVEVMLQGAAGLALGAVSGWLFGRYVLHLRKVHGQALGYNDFLALGVIGVTYGLAELIHVYGFLAVFAAGYALRAVEMEHGSDELDENLALPVSEEGREELARDPEKGPMYLTASVLVFNEHYERMTEFGVVIMFGIIFSWEMITIPTLLFTATLFLLVRPLSVFVGLAGTDMNFTDRGLIAWLGLRGIGSLFYLAYAISHGLGQFDAERMVAVTCSVVAASIFLHGASVTPLMRLFRHQ